jgi:hypothetical protein
MANDPIMNVAGNVNPDMMGSHAGIGLAYGRLKRREERSRQFSDDKRLTEREYQLKANLMTHGANLSDWQQRRAAGIDSDQEVRASGGIAAATARNVGAATTVMGPNGQMIGRSFGYNAQTGASNLGGFTAAPAKPKKQAAGPAVPENERPTNVVNPADTNPMAGRQFGGVDSSVQGAFDLRESKPIIKGPNPKPQPKKIGAASAMEWGPLSKEDKEMDALRTTKAQAARDEISLAETPVEQTKPAKKTKSSKVSSEEVL